MKKRWSDWLDANRQRRDQLVGFAFSCCVHLALVLGLSLLAVGTGSVDLQSLMLDASEISAEEELMLIQAEDWELPPSQVDAPAEAETPAVQLPHLSQLSVASGAAPKMDAPKIDAPSPQETAETSTTQGSASPAADKEPKFGTPAMTTATIQNRVTKAGGKKGEVQFALAWRNVNDVDLHVITPSGEHISHQHRRSRCAGMLDVDMNVEGESEEPVENVRWITNAPMGRYTVLVNFFKLNSEGVRRPRRQSPYQLLAQLGSESLLREAVAGFGEQQVTVWRFQYVPETFSSREREQLLRQLEQIQTQEESAAAPMLEHARVANGTIRQRILQTIVQSYPHTDAAIEAMQMMEGEVIKRGSR
ncbi:MAG: hypothetical protein SFV81_20485 [Pirellulaceae bacterium]|nr:hypothetical protein [Pirellulaceae bacterium]